MNAAKPEALAEWRELLGAEHVRDDAATLDHYARTTQPHGTRPACVLRPADAAQVQALVRVAAAHSVPLYPISCGKNWGYGDACAAADGTAIVDVGRMNRIVETDATLGYVVIEPGVTQQQLYDHVRAHAPGFWMDATGAGPDASIVGNALDRGFGHTPYGDHLRTCCGLDIVLADGRLLSTGFGHYPNARARHVYPYGVGPALDGLFTQSNYGIAVRMGVWLWPKPEAFRFFYVQVPDDAALPQLVDALRPLRMSGLLNSAVHIGNDLRIVSASQPYPWERANSVTPLPAQLRNALKDEAGVGAWNVSGSLVGSRAGVRAAARALCRAMRGLGRTLVIGDAHLRWGRLGVDLLNAVGLGGKLKRQLDALEPNYGLLQGKPTRWPIAGTHWRLRNAPADRTADPLDCGAGLLWASPVLPLRGEDAQRVMAIAEPILARHGFDPLVTFTMLNERSMVCVLNISFDHAQPGEADAAYACYSELIDALIGAGYIPYRSSPGGMAHLRGDGDVYWESASAIKRALDPNGIIAPGRYISDRS